MSFPDHVPSNVETKNNPAPVQQLSTKLKSHSSQHSVPEDNGDVKKKSLKSTNAFQELCSLTY